MMMMELNLGLSTAFAAKRPKRFKHDESASFSEEYTERLRSLIRERWDELWKVVSDKNDVSVSVTE